MKRQMLALVVVAALMPWPLLITQDHWWAFAVVSAAVVAALRLVLGPQWGNYAGLKLSPWRILATVATFVAVATGSKLLLHHVYEAAGLRAGASAVQDQIGFLFQALNEEIFFRALMIGVLVHYVRSKTAISLGLAFLFAAAHFALYRFSNPMHLALSLSALTTVFCAGVAWNNLYLAFRHIGFSWALHAGWNVAWLPAAIYDVVTNERLYEPQIFDRVLGSPTVVAVACTMAVLSFLLVAPRDRALRGRAAKWTK